MPEGSVPGIGRMGGRVEPWQTGEVMIGCPMLGTQLLPLLAMSRMGKILVPVLVATLFLYLAIKGLLTGKVRARSATYTKEENLVMFWFCIFGWFMAAFLMFVLLLEAVFEP